MAPESPVPGDVQRVVEQMSDADWRALILQLGRYAIQKSRRFYWRTGSSGQLPYGEVTESIVSKALLLWLGGRRRWNRLEYDSLENFLRSVIDSLLSHSATGSDNRGIDREATESAPVAVLQQTPESELLDKERAWEAEQLLAEVVRQSQQDEVASEIIGAIQNGATTRRDIARVTGRSPEAIDNGLKRLRRVGASVARGRSYEIEPAG